MFENKIIKLRKLSTNDYSTYHNWRNDIEVMKTTSPQLDIYTLEETEQFISVIASQANAKGLLFFIFLNYLILMSFIIAFHILYNQSL